MAEIHPNDIGLATFSDVGDVEKLKTSAKNLVDALNEIYQNGTQGGSGGFDQQWYVDGENNIILGENNLVYGSNNFIIGSDNIIVGDNINMIASGKQKYDSLKYSLTGIKSGDIIIFRCFNSINTIIFSTLTVKSVSGNTIYLTDDASPGGAGQYAHQLFPDCIIFVQNGNSSYVSSSVAGGCYGMATGKYSLADSYHVISAADNAVTFGKYGVNEDACSIALANGTAIKTPGLAFNVHSDGSVHADKEYTSPCADYAGYGEKGRFQYKWSESRVTLNKCYTYPLLFNTAVPGCSHITMDIEIENTGSGTVLGRSWDFYIYRQNYGWYEVCSFTLPDDGKYTIDTDISNYIITQIACVPSSNPGSSRTWSTWYNTKKLTITESITLSELENDKYFYGVFPNNYGVQKQPSEIFVNIDGTLKKATAVYANVDGSLVFVPALLSSEIKTDSETMKLFKFTSTTGGNYTIKVNRKSGDHEILLYNGNFKPMTDYNKLYTWHCGDGKCKYGITNRNSVGIEICVNSDGNYDSAFCKAVELTKHLMKELNISLERVVRHYDASRKNCPASMSKNSWALWNTFKNKLTENEENLTMAQYDELKKEIGSIRTDVDRLKNKMIYA